MAKNNEQEFLATAFLSCSLREEDKEFTEFIEHILKTHKIKPIGTVGRFSASPMNIAEHMRQNIPLADFIVIVATPRYIQKDIKTGNKSLGLSEMVHVEAGMAYMAKKPVLAFVQEGTNVGNFLPNVTQYITLNGRNEDLKNKWELINDLIRNTFGIIQEIKKQVADKSFLNALTTGLAIFGGYKLFQSFNSDD